MAAAKKEKKPKNKISKPPKAAKEKKAKAADGKSAAGAADSSIGHNSKVPTQKDLEGYFGRLDNLHVQKNEANARYMSDIKGVMEEAANKFGCGRKIVRIIYNKKRAEEAFADNVAEFENKDRDDMDRIMAGAAKLFGEDTAFGAWLTAQGNVKGVETTHAEEPKEEKTPAQAAQEAFEKDQRDQQQVTH